MTLLFPCASKQLCNWLRIKAGALDPPLDVLPLHLYFTAAVWVGVLSEGWGEWGVK